MLAAETAFEALVAKDTSAEQLSSYAKKFEASWAYTEMWKSRNFHSNFHDGLALAIPKNALAMAPVIGDMLGSKTRTPVEPDFATKRTLSDVGGLKDLKKGSIFLLYDGKLFMDKLSDVYLGRLEGRRRPTEPSPSLEPGSLRWWTARRRTGNPVHARVSGERLRDGRGRIEPG